MNWTLAVLVAVAMWIFLFPYISLAAKYFFAIFMCMTGGG